MSKVNRYTNKNGKATYKFRATLKEDLTNLEFYLYEKNEDGKGVVNKFDNGMFQKLSDANRFTNGFPFWGGKFAPVEQADKLYLDDNYKVKMYGGEVIVKVTKKKYGKTVLPYMIFKDGSKRDGVIPAGSLVDVVVLEETYIDRKTKMTCKKLTLNGITIIDEMISNGVQEVVNYGVDLNESPTPAPTPVVDNSKEILEAINNISKENKMLLARNKILCEATTELNEKQTTALALVEKEMTELRTEVKELKALQIEKKHLEYNQEEETNGGLEGLKDILNDVSMDIEEQQFDEEDVDDIPF